MPSEKKKKKVKNSYQSKSALKDKGVGIKGLTFFTSSERRRVNSMTVQLADYEVFI